MNPKKRLDVLSIGDVFIDIFIELPAADIEPAPSGQGQVLEIPWGDKIPYSKSTSIVGVGNAGNAAVSAARLGAVSGLLAITGNDADGQKIWDHFKSENVLLDFLGKDANLPTNDAYVLQYGPERTILVNQQPYAYEVPSVMDAYDVKWVYLTSLNKESLDFHHHLVEWLNRNPNVKLAFQPGTFQMELGKDILWDVYKRTDIFFCNKEESQRILGIDSADYALLHAGIRALGPKIVVITDGPNGLTYSTDNANGYHLPMYPDPKPPISRTGAGDATSSTITTALALGIPLDEAVTWGPINSMSVVQHVGAQGGLLKREELLNFLKNAPADYAVTKIF